MPQSPRPAHSARLALIALLGAALLPACVEDANTVLEPDPIAADTPDGAPDPDPEPDAAAPVGTPRVMISPVALALDGPGATTQLRVSSVGDAPLTIERISRRGDPGFAVTHGGRNALLLSPAELSGGPDGLAPGLSLVLTVEALAAPPASAVLVVETDDPDQPVIEVPVGFPEVPCLRASPATLEFGDVGLGVGEQRALRLVNCGAVPVDLGEVRIEDPRGQFGLVGAPAVGPVPPDGFVDIVVRYTARIAGPGRAEMAVEAGEASLTVQLTARAVEPQCPVAVLAVTDVAVAPLDAVVLDGSGSFDTDGPGGLPVRWQWTVIARPEGSVASPVESLSEPEFPNRGGPVDDPETPGAVFVPDLPGRYVIELRVLDARECADTMQLVIETCPCNGEGITVVLDWTTPGDPDPDDAFGVDADLHLRHPNSDDWFSDPYDCHYANATPDWGQIGNVNDDPQLDIDRAGSGPETIVLARTENTDVIGVPYLVGVHINGYRAPPDGEPGVIRGVPVTVRIYVGAVLTYEANESLGNGQMWEVATIHQPAGRVEARDVIYVYERP